MQTLAKPTLIKRGLDARSVILSTINVANDVVCSTLGPGGANVLIQTDQGTKITKDGISCLMSIIPDNPFESAVLNVLKDACMKTNKNAGDGTSSTVALIADMVLRANGRRDGLNGIQIRNGLMLAAKVIADKLKDVSLPIGDLSTPEGARQLQQIARISTNGDVELADMIVSIFAACGENANVKIELSNSAMSEYNIVDGFQLSKGYLSTYFADSDGTVTMTDPDIYVSEKAVNSLPELTPVINSHMQLDKPFIIIAPKFELSILNALVMHKIRGLRVCCILLAEFGTSMRDTLEDIAILTDAKLISEQTGITFRTTNECVPGTAKSVIIDEFKTTIIGGGGDKANIDARVEALNLKMSHATDDGRLAGDLRCRIDNLKGGIAILNIGGNTSARARERYDLADDAVHACKAAIESGVLPGGGSALLQFSTRIQFAEFFDALGDKYGTDSATYYGAELLFNACQTISRMVIKNALNIEATYSMQHELMSTCKLNTFMFDTFNLKNQCIEPALTVGVIDPTDVVRNEILNAAEAAGALLTMESIIVNVPKPSSDIVDALTTMAN